MSRPVLSVPPGTAGLCATCEHLRLQASKTSVFVRCGLAEVDARFPKYPPLPVRVCGGYEKTSTDGHGQERTNKDCP